MPVILITWEAEIGRITVWGQPGQTVLETPISKVTRAKWTGGVVQAVEHLLCTCKTLNSNPVPNLAELQVCRYIVATYSSIISFLKINIKAVLINEIIKLSHWGNLHSEGFLSYYKSALKQFTWIFLFCTKSLVYT
jgi:hypothetical protein